MAINILHSTEVIGTNSTAYEVSANAWNEDHVLTGTAFKLLGFGSDGSALEYDYSVEVNVKDYGAVGDGATDDTAAITAAIAACTTLSRPMLMFPAGTYYTATQVDFSVSNVVIKGFGATLQSPLETVSAAYNFSGDDISIYGLKLLLEGGVASSGAYVNVTGERVHFYDGSDISFTEEQDGQSLYVRAGANGFRFINSIMRYNSALIFLDSIKEFIITGNTFVGLPSGGGDDCIALKAIAGVCELGVIGNNTYEGVSNLIGIGSQIGTLGADDPTFSKGVRNISVLGNVGIDSAGCVYIKPGAIATDYRNGFVEGITISNNTLYDLTGGTFQRFVTVSAGRGGAVRNVQGDNNLCVARASGTTATGHKNALDIYAVNSGAACVIEDIDVAVSYVDPYDGAAFGAVGTSGYPINNIVGIENDNTNGCTFRNIRIRVEGDGCANSGIDILPLSTELDGAVTIVKAILRNINETANVNAKGIRTAAADVAIGSDVSITMLSGSEFGVTGSGSFTSVLPKQIATDTVIGRATAGDGEAEEIACTAAGRALLDDADASAQRTTLGLGTAALVDIADYTFAELLSHDFSSTAASTVECDVTGYTELVLIGYELVHANSVRRAVQFSVDGGSVWFTASGNYIDIGATGTSTARAALLNHTTDAAAARSFTTRVVGNTGRIPLACQLMTAAVPSYFVGSATAVNRIRLLGSAAGSGTPDAGNFTSGKFIVLGRK